MAGRQLPDPRHPFNQGVLLRTCSTPGPTASATRRRRTWWPSTRARRCTTAASARAHRLRVAGHRGQPHGERFYDEGEDFWPKRYAIWGRLVAQQPGQAHSVIDAKAIGRLPPVFPGAGADTLPELARQLG